MHTCYTGQVTRSLRPVVEAMASPATATIRRESDIPILLVADWDDDSLTETKKESISGLKQFFLFRTD